MYRQSDGSLAMAFDEYIIDASKVFVDLWVNFFLGTECINQNGSRWKVLFWGFRLNSNMLNISFEMGMFSY